MEVIPPATLLQRPSATRILSACNLASGLTIAVVCIEFDRFYKVSIITSLAEDRRRWWGAPYRP